MSKKEANVVIDAVEKMVAEALHQERTGETIDVTDGLTDTCKGFITKGIDLDQAILDELYDGRNDSDFY